MSVLHILRTLLTPSRSHVRLHRRSAGRQHQLGADTTAPHREPARHLDAEHARRAAASSARQVASCLPRDLCRLQRPALAARALRSLGGPPRNFRLFDTRTGAYTAGPTPDAVVYQTLLSELFLWSYFVHMDDGEFGHAQTTRGGSSRAVLTSWNCSAR